MIMFAEEVPKAFHNTIGIWRGERVWKEAADEMTKYISIRELTNTIQIWSNQMYIYLALDYCFVIFFAERYDYTLGEKRGKLGDSSTPHD